jgi:hypothetical protein
MKNLLFALLLTINLPASAQNCSQYIVIKIIGGKAVYKGSKSAKPSELKEGQTISSIKPELLTLSSNSAKILFKDACKGGEIPYPLLKMKSGSPQLIHLIYNFSGDTKKTTTATKGDDDYYYLQSIFTAGGKPNAPNILGITGEEQAIKLNLPTFPLDEKHFFYVEFVFKGDTIRKQIENFNGGIIIRKESIFLVKGKDINESEATNMRLFYMNGSLNKTTYICNLNLYFETDKEIIQALKQN